MARKFPVPVHDFQTLREMGYKVQVFKWWHYRVSAPWRDFHLDIYPSTRTYIKKVNEGYIPWEAKKYDDLIYLVETTLQ